MTVRKHFSVGEQDTREVLQDGDVPDVVIAGVHGVVAVVAEGVSVRDAALVIALVSRGAVRHLFCS